MYIRFISKNSGKVRMTIQKRRVTLYYEKLSYFRFRRFRMRKCLKEGMKKEEKRKKSERNCYTNLHEFIL